MKEKEKERKEEKKEEKKEKKYRQTPYASDQIGNNPSKSDPDGSYTGQPKDKKDKPVQDSDDL